MKKKLLLALAVILLAALGAAAWAHYRHESTYITIHGVEYRRDATELSFTVGLPDEPEAYAQLTQVRHIDLTRAKVTAEEYEALQAAMPGCTIDWNVPFQNDYLPHDTRELTIVSLTSEDLERLVYFTQLQTVCAEGCRDYDQLLALIAERPELVVSYTVPISGREYPRDTEELTLTDVDITELTHALPLLPRVSRVTLEGTLPEAEALLLLREQYPSIEFYWQIEVLGQTADVHTRELDLSGIPMTSTEEVEAAAAYLPGLEKVLMLDCGIPDEEMHGLNQRHENILFVWNVKLNGQITLRSDATIFAPVVQNMYVWNEDLVNLKYCTELVVIDLGHMELTNCEFLRDMRKLEYLILADTYITDISPMENLTSLKYLELFMSPVMDYSPLWGCKALEDLNLCYTQGDPASLEQMTWLKRLWVNQYNISDTQFASLVEALPETQVVIPSYGSTSDGWRNGYLYYEMRDMLGLPYYE